MKPQSRKATKRGYKKSPTGIKYSRKTGAYHKAYRALKKKQDPLFWKSHQLRSNWRARAKKLGMSLEEIPSAPEIKAWLEAQKPFVCYYTNTPLKPGSFGIDHKVPLSRGGSLSLDNLVITSVYINGAKGSLTDSEFRQLLDLISLWEDKGKGLLSRLRSSGTIYNKTS